MRRTASLAPCLGVALALGCDASTPAPLDAGADARVVRDAGTSTRTVGPAERPARLALPPAHDGTTRLPLVVLLHGYGASGAVQDAYLGLSAVARDRGLYLLLPDGTVDASGSRFWNASEACCNFGGVSVDDVAYLEGLLDAVEAEVPVDTSRVYFMGHSNGGFMSYRMACERASRVTAIAALAGTEFSEATRCAPAMPVSVLHLHGDADDTIGYTGGTISGATYPGAEETVARWVMRDGCDAAGVPGAALDFTTADGAETEVTDWSAGCAGGTQVSLWHLVGAGHIPPLARGAVGLAVDWLLEHTR